MSELDEVLEQSGVNLEKKDVYGFAAAVGIAKYIAKSTQDLQSLREVMQKEIHGIEQLGQYQKFGEVIDEAIGITADEGIKLELLLKKGVGLVRIGCYDDGIEVFQSIMKEDNLRMRIRSIISLAWTHIQRYQHQESPADLEQAESFCNQALEYRGFDEILFARALTNLGVILWYKQDFAKTLSTFLEVNEIYKGENPNALNNLAATYVSLNDLEKAEKLVKLAEKKALQQKNYFEEAQSLFIRARIEEEILEDYIRAKDIYMAAYDMYLDVNCFEEAFKTLRRVAVLDQLLNDQSVAILAKKLGNHSGRVIKLPQLKGGTKR